VRCRTGAPLNNGRPLRLSDLIYYRPYQLEDNFGRPWPGVSDGYCGHCGTVSTSRMRSSLVTKTVGSHGHVRSKRTCGLLMSAAQPAIQSSGTHHCRHALLLHAGNPRIEDDLFYTQCWDEDKVITVRIGDSCPCKYSIRGNGGTGEVTEVRTQNWCCGGNNHFDLSFWAFEQLAHPSYGVMPIEYRPVNCETGAPLR
jgi:hypothetical protein